MRCSDTLKLIRFPCHVLPITDPVIVQPELDSYDVVRRLEVNTNPCRLVIQCLWVIDPKIFKVLGLSYLSLCDFPSISLSFELEMVNLYAYQSGDINAIDLKDQSFMHAPPMSRDYKFKHDGRSSTRGWRAYITNGQSR